MKYLKDYTPYPFIVSTVNLQVELDPAQTRVTATLAMERNPRATDSHAPLQLNGEHLELVSISLDDRKLAATEYDYNGSLLTISQVPDKFELECVTLIAPEANTALEGLYRSSGNYCTQCEAEGFRRITCYPDRPDVMAVFTTTIVGNKQSCPVLLSNGNLIDSGQLDNGRHFATWNDPFPKPGYLFALVAGDLVQIADSFTTMSGRTIALHIYVEEQNRTKCDHAMQSLKKAMRWDEEVFGLEYDLDTYMIVAVDDFNMGAMENKGLNVFNSKYVLARPETATDGDYEGIEGVIAHEYFHNWTGNRITCRDWFQLSLKEGLTVFRDQEFSSDMGSRPVKRIQDVNIMRSFQFREDSGPMAHPVRPAAFAEINNFYTLTVYNKGAEVIRMLHTLLGAAGFRKGMNLYFDRHDGQAVTCDDFVWVMEDANDRDLSQFKRWYNQAGTPLLTVEQQYDEDTKEYCLTIRQSSTDSPGQPAADKKPFFMPIGIGLLNGQGQDMELCLQGEGQLDNEVLIVEKEEQQFCFSNIEEKPVLSFNRNFSAPVKVQTESTEQELAFLMANDQDPFNRWDAGQQFGLNAVLAGIADWQQGRAVNLPELFQTAFKRVLMDQQADPAFVSAALILPGETWISQQLAVIDPQAVFAVRQQFRYQLSCVHRDLFFERYYLLESDEPYRYSAEEAGRRALRNICLAYMLAVKLPVADTEPVAPDLLEVGVEQYWQADNMTDVSAALAGVVNADQDAAVELLADFYQKWQHDPLVVDKWLILQATSQLPGTLDRVKALLSHPAFSMKNPNKVRSLIGAFCSNLHQFHASDGSGYLFLSERIMELDPMNPQIAARLLTPLTMWKRYDSGRQELMKTELERIGGLAGLSGDVKEIVDKSLL